ncbi:hypothetical protein PDPUS_2_00899 [Photobacterium damselae subsp. piscicida]|uniref:Uncharacterized protein n=1 Tax=Photobacterium damsela subsp. piscicida TaxID=38294 RepID=A0A1V1VE09_PHODP|nr:hypothetical protein [Photobacterium damselae]MBE8127282.1 hypothetical protein [Photobacterium damselae subsp. piscicida]MDP2567366.1 hypothetical protein [Photobacterium damselae subsp. piscicida]PSV74399.1 hypothetical protein CTT35_08705 [Photobacterium damselae]PSW77856.1 hypothetical protein CTT37_09160 [Photobacterium damselae]QOD54856.1 hypothetical protein IC628_18025 [Photobacterium damselae subsp. piscicida]
MNKLIPILLLFSGFASAKSIECVPVYKVDRYAYHFDKITFDPTDHGVVEFVNDDETFYGVVTRVKPTDQGMKYNLSVDFDGTMWAAQGTDFMVFDALGKKRVLGHRYTWLTLSTWFSNLLRVVRSELTTDDKSFTGTVTRVQTTDEDKSYNISFKHKERVHGADGWEYVVFDVTGKDDRRIMGYGYVIEDNQKYMEHGVYGSDPN